MIILYTDESGVAANRTQHFFVLAGISIFERQTYWLASELDKIASRFNAADPSSIELHGSSMFTGRGYWRRIPAAQRIQAIKDALAVLQNAHYTNKVFACIVRKSLLQEEDAITSAFKHLVANFDAFLKQHHKTGKPQKGIIIFDKSPQEGILQALSLKLRRSANNHTTIRNLAEVPLFADSKASRLIQLADLVAYALFRHYEHGDFQFSSIIHNRIQRKNGRQRYFKSSTQTTPLH